MKTPKTKSRTKEVKKNLKNDFELSLRKKMKDFIVGLGHDAEDIGAELKKASKILAKKLGTKLKDLKQSVDTKKDVKKSASSNKIAKKDLEKTTRKLTKVIVKASKKAVDKATDIEEIIKKEVIAPAQVIIKDKPTNAGKPPIEEKKEITSPKETKALAKPKQTVSKSVKTTTESSKTAASAKSNQVKSAGEAKKAPVKRANASSITNKKKEDK